MQHPFAQEIVPLAGHEHVEKPIELPAEGFAMRASTVCAYLSALTKSPEGASTRQISS
jgi:hypothetical protein